jgi:hypothetical protein
VIDGSFLRVIESDNNLILLNKNKENLVSYSLENDSTTIYRVPSPKRIKNFVVCPKSKFIIAIVDDKYQNNITSILCWIWSKEEYLYIFDSKKKLKDMEIINGNELLVTYRTGFYLFDILNVEFKEKYILEWDLNKIFVRKGKNLLVSFKTRGFYTYHYGRKQKQKLSGSSNVLQVYVPDSKQFLEVADINNIVRIDF